MKPHPPPTVHYPPSTASRPLSTVHYLLFTVYCLLLTACAPALAPDGSLALQMIEQKSDPAYAGQEQYTALEPGLVVIASAEEAAAAELWFGQQARRELRGLNYDRFLALAAFQGWQIAGGYGAYIDRVTVAGDVVTVHATFTAPAGDGGGGVTSPYHLVRVRKPGNWPAAPQYQLLVNGEVVASVPTPAP